MKKEEIIKKHEDFNNIIQNGKVIKTSYFAIYYLPNEDHKTLFGIAVGRKMGNAVVRNKLKRQYRSIIDQNKLLFKNNYNYIIMIKKGSLTVPFGILNQTLKETIEKGEL